MQPRTDWRLVALLIGAGLLSAFQVGKAAIAIPQLRQDLGLGLAEASWVVGAYGAIGALTGAAAGALIARMGARAALVAGLLTMAGGSAAGAFAGSLAQLLAARLAEGCGFLAVVIAAPAILNRVTAPHDRNLCFAFWGAYMPVGTAVMMMAGPALMQSGWRLLWLVNGALACIYAIVLLRSVDHQESDSAPESGAGSLRNVAQVITAPGPLLLGLAFGVYTFQYFALTTLLPTLLVERLGLSLAEAGFVSALVVLANAAGNLSAGGLMRLGIPLWATAGAGFVCVALFSFGVFSDLSTLWVCLFAAASLAVSGTIPASIFAGAPRLASASHLPVTLGLIMQASNLGQLLGPIALAAWIERLSWSASPAVFILVGVTGLLIAVALRSRMRRA